MASARPLLSSRGLCKLCSRPRVSSSRPHSQTELFSRIPRQCIIQSSRHSSSSSSSPSSSSKNASSTSEPYASVDPSEISHFSTLASSWWDPHGPSRLLHLMNPLRHTFISRCRYSVGTPEPGAKQLRYLDIGCGGGIFAESAARLSTTDSVTAIDPTAAVLAIARAHARTDPLLSPPKLNYLHSSIEDLPVPLTPAEAYDVVTLFEVLEHVAQPSPFLDRLLPFVKPGGWLILSTISRTWTSWFTTKLVAEELVRIVPRGTHDWNRYINESELRGWFDRKSDWGEARSMGVIYVPGLGWKEVTGSESWGNYFFGVQRLK